MQKSAKEHETTFGGANMLRVPYDHKKNYIHMKRASKTCSKSMNMLRVPYDHKKIIYT
jgi:hypothetical protein